VVTVTSEHTLNVTAPTDLDPTALCVDAPPQTAIPEVKDRACAAQLRGHECGAEVTAVDAATHAYVPAVTGCWAAVTQLRAV